MILGGDLLMNITRAYIFKMKNSNNCIIAWESAEISDLMDDTHFVLIGAVNYDTELNEIVEG